MVIDKDIFTYFFIPYCIIIFFQRIFETFAKRAKVNGRIEKKWTFTAMAVVHFFIFLGAILEYFISPRPVSLPVTLAGLCLYCFGLALRNYARKTLEGFWSIHIEIRDAHRFIREGPYRYIRHPAYLAILCEVAGIALIPNAYVTLLMGFPAYLLFTIIRIRYEEAELIKKFGQQYLDYKKQVRALLPL
jgi:protein-S-isoprenylcysteine O-methyltransferase Ste14